MSYTPIRAYQFARDFEEFDREHRPERHRSLLGASASAYFALGQDAVERAQEIAEGLIAAMRKAGTLPQEDFLANVAAQEDCRARADEIVLAEYGEAKAYGAQTDRRDARMDAGMDDGEDAYDPEDMSPDLGRTRLIQGLADRPDADQAPF